MIRAPSPDRLVLGELRPFNFSVGRCPETETPHVPPDLVEIKPVVKAEVRQLQVDTPAPEGRAEIHQEVPKIAATILLDPAVLGILRTCIVVVGPRREQSESAKLATMLMSNDVVRIVRSCAVIPKRTEGSSRDVPARGHSHPPIRDPRNLSQAAAEKVAGQRLLISELVLDHRPRFDRESRFRVDSHDVILWGVVSHRIEQHGPDDLGGRAELRNTDGVKLDDVAITPTIDDLKARYQAANLAAKDAPRHAHVRTIHRIRSTDQFVK